METNEMVMNEEVIGATEEVATSNAGKAVKKAALIGGMIIVGNVIRKKVIKPVIAKFKARKKAKADAEFEEIVADCENIVVEE